MNAPKKLWFDIEECSAGPVKFNDDEILYIREDVVLELVEALKYVMTAHGEQLSDAFEKAQAALAKLEESR